MDCFNHCKGVNSDYVCWRQDKLINGVLRGAANELGAVKLQCTGCSGSAPGCIFIDKSNGEITQLNVGALAFEATGHEYCSETQNRQ